MQLIERCQKSYLPANVILLIFSKYRHISSIVGHTTLGRSLYKLTLAIYIAINQKNLPNAISRQICTQIMMFPPPCLKVILISMGLNASPGRNSKTADRKPSYRIEYTKIYKMIISTSLSLALKGAELSQ